jgi:anti-sigma regulatory factor (Ser/Thr protein kinase)
MANEMALKLRAAAHAPAVARRALSQLEDVDSATLDTVQLLVSELVTNSYRHGRLKRDDNIELIVSARPDRLHVEVADPGVGFDPRRDRAHRDKAEPRESGWGLQIVEELSDGWGVEDNGGTVVWFDLMRTSA